MPKTKIKGDVKITGDLDVKDKLEVHKFDTDNLKINVDDKFSEVFNQSTNVGNLVQLNFSVALLQELNFENVSGSITVPTNGLYKIAI